MKNALRVLILEDLKTDQELVKRQVLKFNPNSTFIIANDKESFFEKVDWMQADLILSDYNLPDFDGLQALFHIRKQKPNVPFIFITGTLNNEQKVAESILQGADGYVLKENLNILPQRIEEVLSKSALRMKMASEKAEILRKRKLLIEKLKTKIETLQSEPVKPGLLEIVAEIEDLI